MKKIITSGILMLMLVTVIRAQEDLTYLKDFSKIYGYVKYFHPSTEAAKIDWNVFAAYGVSKILECESDTDFLIALDELYKPLAPTIVFSELPNSNILKRITPDNTENYLPSYWQHTGVSIGMNTREYSSVLVNQSTIIADSIVISKPIFDEHPKIGACIEKKLACGIYCSIPLALYSNGDFTHPQSESLDSLKYLIAKSQLETSELSVRIGNIINVHNVMHHFYPYFAEVDVDWNKEFETALHRCFKDETEDDHLISIKKFLAPLKDGHTWVWKGEIPFQFYPDIHWEWIQDSLVITKVLNDTLNIQVGDIVTRINNQKSDVYFKEINSRISHSTKTYLNHINQIKSLSSKENTVLTLEINNEEYSLKHTNTYKEYQRNLLKIQEHMYTLINEEVMYVNLAKINPDTLTKILPQLQQMKGLVCDYRGRNLSVWNFLAHFSKEEIPDGAIVKLPQNIYPDQEKIVGYKEYKFPYEPMEPYLGDIKTVFIVDGQVKSAGESFISTVKHSQLATIVGEQTGGVNGMVNIFKVLGDITIWWTGAKVTNPDGSQFHCVGIEPDVPVEKTIKAIRDGRDVFLEKAIHVVTHR